ncbi:MAG: fasciclin domain-containing protein, partial [Chitinophagaceae bacterium]
DAVTSSILGTSAGSFYTIFVPNNNAIRQAITDGYLPGTVASPNFTPTTTADKVLVEKFIQYHIIDKRTVITDKKDTGGFLTLLKNAVGDPVQVSVNYIGNIFEVSDVFNRKSRIVAGAGNELSNRTVIHLIDNYLKYTN